MTTPFAGPNIKISRSLGNPQNELVTAQIYKIEYTHCNTKPNQV